MEIKWNMFCIWLIIKTEDVGLQKEPQNPPLLRMKKVYYTTKLKWLVLLQGNSPQPTAKQSEFFHQHLSGKLQTILISPR